MCIMDIKSRNINILIFNPRHKSIELRCNESFLTSIKTSYIYSSGPTPWRDQMTPKDWLYDKARREGWDEPVWNSNTCVMVNRKIYKLSEFEANKVNHVRIRSYYLMQNWT